LLTQCETLRAQIGELERLASALADEAADGRETLETLIHTAHRIAGTGGTMGFDAISHKAFALETFAKQLLRKPDTARREGVAMVRALTRSLASVGANVTPEHSRLRQRLLMRG
jgi:HPt (histidine-containing phosphotransfer) domain-containing protein